jgi:hypothetical protein
MYGMRDPVKFARNAALFSGVPALATIILGIVDHNVALALLPSLALLCAVTGVMIWARQEREGRKQDVPRPDEDDAP